MLGRRRGRNRSASPDEQDSGERCRRRIRRPACGQAGGGSSSRRGPPARTTHPRPHPRPRMSLLPARPARTATPIKETSSDVATAHAELDSVLPPARRHRAHGPKRRGTPVAEPAIPVCPRSECGRTGAARRWPHRQRPREVKLEVPPTRPAPRPRTPTESGRASLRERLPDGGPRSTADPRTGEDAASRLLGQPPPPRAGRGQPEGRRGQDHHLGEPRCRPGRARIPGAGHRPRPPGQRHHRAWVSMPGTSSSRCTTC